MELMIKCLCFLLFLHTVSSEVVDDVVFDLVSRRLDHISVTLSRIARKQKVLETRINDNAAVRNYDCCKESQKEEVTNLDFIKGWLGNELAVIKRAISSEKEYVRNLEMKMETNAAGQTTPIGLNSRMEVMEKKVTDKAMSSALKSKLESVENGLHSVATMSSSLQNRVDSLEKTLRSVESTSDDIENRVDSMESSISSLVLASARKVSFSAQFRPVGGTAAIFTKERVINFNHVFYNDGSGYNETTGVFTVPVSGVYQFIFFAEGWQNDDDFSCSTAAVGLYLDGKAQTAAVAEPRHAGQHTQAGNAYINYFRKGQIVVVGTGSACDKYTIFAYRTTFSGVLLY